jgi:TPP-dependent pyruvate/acetoin dehydrogenase alpha subunit
MHFQGEPATYRSKEEETEWFKKDPLIIAKDNFKASGLMDDSDFAETEKAVEQELEEAVEYGRKSPFPAPEDALTDVYV